MKSKGKEAEVLKVERDQLKMRVDQLADIEAKYMQLLDKTRGFDAIKNERDMYKQKYEEMLGLECECDILRAQLEGAKEINKERDALQRQVRDCECCIADQEDEIKRLVTHVDKLTNGKDDQQVNQFFFCCFLLLENKCGISISERKKERKRVGKYDFVENYSRKEQKT